MTGSLVLFNSFGRITCEDIELCFVDILLAQPQRSVFSLIHQIYWLILTRVLTAAEFHPNLASVGIIGLILIESMMMKAKMAAGKEMRARLSRSMIQSSSRKDNWKSRKDALQYFQQKRPWRKWDPRVLLLYVVRSFHCGIRVTWSITFMKLRSMVYMNSLTGVSS